MSVIVPVRAMHGYLRSGLLAFQGAGVFADGGCAVTFRPVVERVAVRISGSVACRAGFYRGILKRPPIGETDLHGFGRSELVDRIQMRRRKDVALPARQKYNARDRRRHMTAQAAQRGRGIRSSRRPLWGVVAFRRSPCGFQEHPFRPTHCSKSAWKTAWSIELVTASQRSMV